MFQRTFGKGGLQKVGGYLKSKSTALLASIHGTQKEKMTYEDQKQPQKSDFWEYRKGP